MKDVNYYLSHPGMLLNAATRRLFGGLLPERTKIKLLYHYITGEKLDLDHPKTFSQKLNWLKLYDRKPIYHKMVDKYDAKLFVKDVLGEDRSVPTLGVWNSFEEIDWDSLPNEFVIKATHDCASFYFVRDKKSLDKVACKNRVCSHWNKDYYDDCLEWPYKGLKPRIIAEPIIHDGKMPYLRDFKFYCFNGEPKVFYITSDKGTNLPIKQNFYDIEGTPIDLEDANYPGNPISPELPEHLKEMVEDARKLSQNMYHLRVDFYETADNYYLGELTFYEDAGYCKFKPDVWNQTLGDWIKLPTDK